LKELNDEHLPPPAKPSVSGGQRKTYPGSGDQAGPVYPWLDRLLFAAGGLLLGFAAAYLYLDRASSAFPSQQAASGNPHAGIPGTSQDAGPGPAAAPMSVDPAVRQKLKELQQALAQNPNDYDLLVRVGNAAYDSDDSRLAVDAYEKALKVRGNDPNVMTDLGISYRNTGDPNKALEWFDRAIKVNPDHWQARFNKVVVLGLDKGDKKSALAILAELKKARSFHPELPPLDKLEEALSAK
jgi:tetratricopeptide (TPR) repeat protein